MKQLLIVLSILFFIGCSSGSGSLPANTSTTPGDGGQTPTIRNVVLYNAEDIETPVISFQVGDYMYFVVTATDLDADMTTLYVTEYYPFDSDTIFNGPIAMAMSPQITMSASIQPVEMRYTNLAVIEMTGAAGSYRMEFQVEDAKGNESAVFTVYFSKVI